jgi:hypothetical protein
MPTRARSSISALAFFLPGFFSGFFSGFLPAIVLTNKHIQPSARTIPGWRARR